MSFATSAVLHGHPGAPVRVLIADDHPVVRQGLKMMLSSDSELEVVGEGGSMPTPAMLAWARELRVIGSYVYGREASVPGAPHTFDYLLERLAGPLLQKNRNGGQP